MNDKETEVTSGRNQELIELLRAEARNGKSVSELVNITLEYLPEGHSRVGFVLVHFKKAFNLSLRHIRDLPGISCLGGGAYTEEEIDKIIRPHIEENFLNKQENTQNDSE